MMANQRRGEITARLNDQDWILCLTLGALARLETSYQSEDLAALISRFSSGKLQARDLILILTAGLQGGGHDVSEEDVADMRIEGGALGFARLVTRLLEVTFNTAPDTENITQSKI